ncbi:hypothetical protein [Vibrio metschnikovii]|uniref:hypothetical protein n=1 Tax=Vibrio metschnikovii TaxID=28172 RepID=UPI001C30BD22|nr:hypothetical protein [Vibrio metschnikovii]
MTKQVSYTQYQKRVIRFLSEYLGAQTPFTYQRTQTNHLKVLIDGVAKPLYTGSTPSDIKSLNNFMAEVKREVRALIAPAQEADQQAYPVESSKTAICFDKLINTCVKSLRTRVKSMQADERAQVATNQSLDGLADYRLNTVKQSIKLALQARRQGQYIKPKEMKTLEKAIIKHLNFMLPSIAYYADLLDTPSQLEVKSESCMEPCQKPSRANLAVISADKTLVAKPVAPLPASENHELNVQNQDSAHQLISLSSANRVSLLRGLSKAQALNLIADIEQALALNQEADIASVVAMIREKDLPLESIIERCQAA